MAELLKFIQARLAKPVEDEAEAARLSAESTPLPHDEAPQMVQHPHINNLQQWLDLNA